MARSIDLRGVHPAPVTPFTADGGLDLPPFRALATAEAPPDGLLEGAA